MAAWDCENGITGAEDVASIKCLEPLFGNLVTAIMTLVGVGLFIMLLIGGYNFLFAGGDQKRLEKARATLTGAFGGLIVIAISFLILSAIGEITGLNSISTFMIEFIQ
jgi:hypothetical protein